jgi:glycosyltransferase involved in cell wall biosynthesis
MACGIPCAVTHVGDSPAIVGETGKIVPPRQPEAMAAAWCELIEAGPESRQCLGNQARQRVIAHFSVTQFAQGYQSLYRNVGNRICDHQKLSFVKSEAS